MKDVPLLLPPACFLAMDLAIPNGKARTGDKITESADLTMAIPAYILSVAFTLRDRLSGVTEKVYLGDVLCMFDFQIKDDVELTLKAIAESNNRKRPWTA